MTDKQRIAQLERDVERLEAACVWLAEHACRSNHGVTYLPQWGPIAALMRRHQARQRKAASS